jgi:hypothetical protein
VRRTGSKNCLNFHLIAKSAQKVPTGHVAEDGGVGVLDRADDALRLHLAIQLEAPGAIGLADWKQGTPVPVSSGPSVLASATLPAPPVKAQFGRCYVENRPPASVPMGFARPLDRHIMRQPGSS